MIDELPSDPQENDKLMINKIPLIFVKGKWVLDQDELEPLPLRHKDIVDRNVGVSHTAGSILVEADEEKLDVVLSTIRSLISDLGKSLSEGDNQASESIQTLTKDIEDAVEQLNALDQSFLNLDNKLKSDFSVIKNDIKKSLSIALSNVAPILVDIDQKVKLQQKQFNEIAKSSEENKNTLSYDINQLKQEVNAKIDKLEETDEDLQINLRELSDRIKQTNDLVVTINQEIDTLSGKVNDVEENINEQSQSQEQLENNFDSLSQQLANTKSDVSVQKDKVEALESKSNALSNAISQTSTRLTDHITAFNDRVDKVDGEIEKISQNEEAISHLNETVSKNTSSIKNIEEEINATVSLDPIDPDDNTPLTPETPWLAKTNASPRKRPLPIPDDKHIGKVVYVRDVDGSAIENNITISKNGNLIEGRDSDLILDTGYSWVRLMCVERGKWVVIAGGV